MALVRIQIRGTETRAEATETAGVDRRFHHPLGRYMQNAHDWRSPLLPTRNILTKKQQETLSRVDSRICLPPPCTQHYLTDYWSGYSQEVKAVVTKPQALSLAPGYISRLAIIAKQFNDGKDELSSVGFANEVLLQVADANTAPDGFAAWQTMAGVMIGDEKHEQRGFVDDMSLLGIGESASPEVAEHATNKFLGSMVTQANFALGRELAA